MTNTPEEKIDVACVACGGKGHSLYAVKAGHKVWKCGSCGTLFLFPLPRPSETESIYGKEYFAGAREGFGYVDYDADKEAMRSVFERYLRDFKRILGKTGRLLDIGAATGYFMKIAEEKGWKTCGVEISPYAAELGRSRGLDIETGTIHSTAFGQESFDMVTMWDVVEHVPDPILDIGKACSLLRPGGLLAINTPDSGSRFARVMGSRWHLLVPPEHIFYFNRDSLITILDKSGFEIIEVGCIGKRFTAEYIVQMLSRQQNIGLWKTSLNFLKRHPSVGRFPIRLNFKDNMYLLAKKK
jgi:SAM-dependent methyltransferase